MSESSYRRGYHHAVVTLANWLELNPHRDIQTLFNYENKVAEWRTQSGSYEMPPEIGA